MKYSAYGLICLGLLLCWSCADDGGGGGNGLSSPRLVLSWDPADDVSSYVVYAAHSEQETPVRITTFSANDINTAQPRLEVPVSSLAVMDAGLTGHFCIRLQAENSMGASPLSDPACLDL